MSNESRSSELLLLLHTNVGAAVLRRTTQGPAVARRERELPKGRPSRHAHVPSPWRDGRRLVATVGCTRCSWSRRHSYTFLSTP